MTTMTRIQLLILFLVAVTLSTAGVFGVAYWFGCEFSILNFIKCWLILGLSCMVGLYLYLKILLAVNKQVMPMYPKEERDDNDFNGITYR